MSDVNREAAETLAGRAPAVALAHATLALVEETARLADAQETACKIAALSVPGLLSEKHRASLIGQIGASLYGGEPHA